jgi:hypothetical protein
VTAPDTLALLATPGSRCAGARAAAASGDRAALAPLLRAWLASGEGEGVCLLEAIRALGPVEGARELFAGNAGHRALAMVLSSLFPDDALLPLLESALADADAEVRRHALRALPLQIRTPAWEALLKRQDASPDPAVRTAATSLLAERHADLARTAR